MCKSTRFIRINVKHQSITLELTFMKKRSVTYVRTSDTTIKFNHSWNFTWNDNANINHTIFGVLSLKITVAFVFSKEPASQTRNPRPVRLHVTAPHEQQTTSNKTENVSTAKPTNLIPIKSEN